MFNHVSFCISDIDNLTTSYLGIYLTLRIQIVPAHCAAHIRTLMLSAQRFRQGFTAQGFECLRSSSSPQSDVSVPGWKTRGSSTLCLRRRRTMRSPLLATTCFHTECIALVRVDHLRTTFPPCCENRRSCNRAPLLSIRACLDPARRKRSRRSSMVMLSLTNSLANL